MSNFLEHLDHADEIGALLQRLRRTMSTGGRIAVLGPNFRYCSREYFDYADHKMALTHLAVEEHLYAAGFGSTRRAGYLPYTFRGRLPTTPALVRAYLRFPLAWKILGKQYSCSPRTRTRPERHHVVARRDASDAHASPTPVDRDRNAVRALWVVVGLAAVVLFYVNRHQWFGGDEWFILTDRGLTAGPGHQGLFEPHYEHWTTVPILAFRALYSVVGLHSYVPYIALVIVAHLATVVLLWHVMVRSRIDAWVALCFVTVFAVLGTGFENLKNAWQVTLVAPLALGLAAILVVPESGPFTRRDVIAAAFMTVAMMCSGVGLPMLVAVALVAFVRTRLAGGDRDRGGSGGGVRGLVPRVRPRQPGSRRCRAPRGAAVRLGRDHRRARRRGPPRGDRRRRRGRRGGLARGAAPAPSDRS